MSSQELFNDSSGNEESCDEQPMTYKQFVATSKRSRCFERSKVVLQTSCSSDEEESPPRSRLKRVGNRNGTFPETLLNRSSSAAAANGAVQPNIRESHRPPSKSANSKNGPEQRHATPYARSVSKTANYYGRKRSALGEITNGRTSSESNHSGKENVTTTCSSPSQSLTSLETALLETNQLLRHVIKRVDNCEKHIKSFEKKFDEAATSSTSAESTPSRKKEVPEEVRVCSRSCIRNSSMYEMFVFLICAHTYWLL